MGAWDFHGKLTLTCVEDVAIFIFWVHAISEKLGAFVVAQFFTQSFEGVFQFSAEHGSVFLFVVQLETFHEVLEATLVLLGFDLRISFFFLLDIDLWRYITKKKPLTCPKMGRNSSTVSFFSPRFFVAPIFSHNSMVGLRFKERKTSGIS
jgi:hypothetical protein